MRLIMVTYPKKTPNVLLRLNDPHFSPRNLDKSMFC